MTELEAYKELIEKRAKEWSKEVLPNAGKEHAAIVMTELFKNTTSNINMLVGSFDGSVSDDKEYLKELSNAIDRGVKINVIFLETPNIQSHTYKLLKEKQKEGKSIFFKSANSGVKSTLSKHHFSVFDNNKYRFEKDIEKYLALVCFNDEDGAGRLNKLFSTYFNLSSTID